MSVWVVACGLLVFGQQTGQKPPRPKHMAAAVSAAPVTASEAREAFARAVSLLQRSHTPPLGVPSIPATGAPVTREQVVAEMTRLYRAAQPAFRFTPAPVAFDATKLRIAPPQRPALESLIRVGCVARIGPLAVGPGAGLTPKEFGDALGFFMGRVAQMAHLPSPKWTPMLQDQ